MRQFIRQKFRETLEESYAELKKASEDGDRDKIQYLAHKISGGAASFGETELANTAKSLEIQLKSDSPSTDALIADMLEGCEAVLSHIERQDT